MTRDQAAALLPIIAAFAEGKTVQQKVSGAWFDLDGPCFNADLFTYRVKPEPILVTGWMNVYPTVVPGCFGTSNIVASRADADRLASPERIACIHIVQSADRIES